MVRRSAPYFRDVVLLYILEFGQFHEQIRRSFETHNQLWTVCRCDWQLDP